MTPQDLRNEQIKALWDFKNGNRTMEQTLEIFTRLQAEYAAVRRAPYYAFLVRFDEACRAHKQTEGHAANELAALATLAALIDERIATLKGEG